MKKLFFALCFTFFVSSLSFGQAATTAPADTTTTPADTTTAPADTTTTPADATTAPADATTTPAPTDATTAPADATASQAPLNERIKKNVTLDVKLEGNAGFTLGADLTSRDISGHDGRVVTGIRNDYKIEATLFLIKSDSYEVGEKKKVMGWIKLKNLGFKVFNKTNNSTKMGTSNELKQDDDQDDYPMVEAKIYFGRFYINVLGDFESKPDEDPVWYGGQDEVDYSTVRSRIDTTIINPDLPRLVKRDSVGPRTIKFSNLLIDGDEGDWKDFKGGSSMEHKGIGFGVVLGDEDQYTIELKVASRFDWSTGYEETKDGDARNKEVPDEYDTVDGTWLAGNNGSVLRNGFNSTTVGTNPMGAKDAKKNFGNDWALGLNFTAQPIEGLHLGLQFGAGVGDWDYESVDNEFNRYGFKHSDTLDPLFLKFNIHYQYQISDNFWITPNLGLTYGVGEYKFQGLGNFADIAMPNTNKLTFLAGAIFNWTTTSPTKYKLLGVDKDVETKYKPGVSLNLIYDANLFSAKKMSLNGTDVDFGKMYDNQLSFDIATFEPAEGGMVPGFGWALDFALTNIARSVKTDVNNADLSTGWKDAETVTDGKLKNKDIRYTLDLLLNGSINVLDGGKVKPAFEVMMLENATAFKFGTTLDLVDLVKNVTFTIGWQSDKIFFTDSGKKLHGYKDSDFGVAFLGAKINF